MQSQGTEHRLSKKQVSSDKEQLQRSAEMFEMILKTSPDTVENYLALKDIYRELKKHADFKRVAKGLARVYLESGETEKAAREYTGVIEIDPNDDEALGKLEQIGYTKHDLPVLQAELMLEQIRRKYEQKSHELQEAEEAFLNAAAKARAVRGGEDNEARILLNAVEEQAEKEIQNVVAEHERWLTDGRTEVFNQVSERLKKQADTIIQQNEFKSIRKSVKKAEKLLASTDKVFTEEWERVSEERERHFQERIEHLKRKKEERFRSTVERAITAQEQEESAADLALRQVKEELKQLEAELKNSEKLLERKRKTVPVQPSPRVPPKEQQAVPEVVMAAADGLSQPEGSPGESSANAPAATGPRDEVGKTLGAILVQHGLVSREHLEEALAKQQEDRRPVGEILVESGYATEEDIINALVAQAGVPYLSLGNYEVGDEVAMIIPGEIALKYALMPVDKIAKSLLVAMGIPLNPEQKKEVQRHAQDMRISYFISSWSDIKAKHEQHYG